ncbi:hypothetical protein BDV95DRAFT_603435 [Massariosphaeria phaeospora]|uniref:Uncharacterized protein n=1 Tax=Massariosphaeria phaeospora TaxID=100035 RepID=A0A7C8IFP9_9PLEO|nr:hypothetical protein BDV95DRAFT_603435 [Massariosphaeria phaeospora]
MPSTYDPVRKLEAGSDRAIMRAILVRARRLQLLARGVSKEDPRILRLRDEQADHMKEALEEMDKEQWRARSKKRLEEIKARIEGMQLERRKRRVAEILKRRGE